MPAHRAGRPEDHFGLEEDGYLTHTRQGRSNEYRIEEGTNLRHPAAGPTVADLLALLAQHDAGHGSRNQQLQTTPPHGRTTEGDR